MRHFKVAVVKAVLGHLAPYRLITRGLSAAAAAAAAAALR
jgi:hypothetical protein